MTIDSEKLATMLLGLVAEAYDGPGNPKMTWFVDNESACGILGTLEKLSAVEASKPFGPGDAAGAATHAGHLLFSLDLANRALRGENVHATAVWKDSWKYHAVDETTWRKLLADLRVQYASFRQAIETGLPWADDMGMTGVFGQLAHGAWHLGAIRQGLGLITTPR
ncbi:MAG: hypothetical protein CVV51_10265 [Spirochaetae bacterium HGW-Spirochaetae-7]|jgi:hypothetical protein|nr:MAG: hypothetical protein CVV51_10265 [Spirochaetae bacterium HGW-Spirochaetae-7]